MYILKNLRIDINLDLKFWEENGIQGLNVKGITECYNLGQGECDLYSNLLVTLPPVKFLSSLFLLPSIGGCPQEQDE